MSNQPSATVYQSLFRENPTAENDPYLLMGVFNPIQDWWPQQFPGRDFWQDWEHAEIAPEESEPGVIAKLFCLGPDTFRVLKRPWGFQVFRQMKFNCTSLQLGIAPPPTEGFTFPLPEEREFIMPATVFLGVYARFELLPDVPEGVPEAWISLSHLELLLPGFAAQVKGNMESRACNMACISVNGRRIDVIAADSPTIARILESFLQP